MIPAMTPVRTIRQLDGIRLGLLLRDGFLGLPATVRTLLLRLVMRVRFLVAVAALATDKEQNLLRVAGTHTDSLSTWSRAVKRAGMRGHGSNNQSRETEFSSSGMGNDSTLPFTTA
jgi:hypothetical protein